MLYELRKQLIGVHDNHHNDDSANAHDGGIALPHTVLDPIQQHLGTRAEQGKGHLLFLWSNQLREAAQTFCAQPGEERPLIPLTDAQTMLADAIRRCHERFICILDNKHGNAYSKYYDYTGCIKTVQTIADNALQSSDYASACENLRLCIHETNALLLSSENDDDSEPLLTLIDDLAMRVRCYMENVAEFADSPTAGKALNTIAQAANDKDMRQCEPLNSMLLISSALAFAQYDDKRIWAYDVIENAITRNLEYSFNEESEESEEDDEDEDNEDTSEVDDETDFISDESLHVLQLFTLMSAYDLYALSNDDAGREQLLKDYPESMALTLMNAANMIHEGRLRSAYMLAQGFLLSSRDTEDVDIDARHNGLLPDLLPHGWHTIMECCAEGLNDVGLLANVYRYYNTQLGSLSAYELQVAVDMLVGSNSRSEQVRKLTKYSGNESIDDLSHKAWNAAWDCYFMSVTDAYETGLEYETGMPRRKTVLVTRNIDPVWLRRKAALSDIESERYALPIPKIECTLDLRKGITDSEVLSILNTVHEMQEVRQSVNPSNTQMMRYIQRFEGEAGLNQSAFVDTPLR